MAAVVDEYIRTAEPVGSKTIAKTAGLGCSSATIRNELADLSQMGYLEQPHTSAGRIPTPKGYRIYVNELMQRQKLSLEETERINAALNVKMGQLDDEMANIGKIASQLTNYPALAFAAPAAAKVVRFDLIYLNANELVIVATMSNSTAQSKLVKLPASTTSEMVQKLNTLCNAHFTNLTEDKITPELISAVERAADDSLGLTSVIAAFAIQVLTESHEASAFITGENRLLNQPEFQNPEKAHKLMSYLSNVGALMPHGEENRNRDEVRVLIGPENVAEELKDSSVIIASYDAGDNMRGLIGVVGPTRMDYSAVAAKLKFLAEGLSKRLGGGDTPPPGMNNKLIVKGDDNNHDGG